MDVTICHRVIRIIIGNEKALIKADVHINMLDRERAEVNALLVNLDLASAAKRGSWGLITTTTNIIYTIFYHIYVQ